MPCNSFLCVAHASTTYYAGLQSTVLASQALLVVSVKHWQDEVFDNLGCKLRRHMLDTQLLVAFITTRDATDASDARRHVRTRHPRVCNGRLSL